MKPGTRTSEFYTSQGASGGLFGLVLSEPNIWVKVACIAAIAFIQVGYTLSRGLEKSVQALEEK